MNYEYYKIFYYVGKHKNITKAAAEMYSSQPAVTRAIQNLESELGCRLFTRNKSGVEFTYEGKTLYDYVSIAFNQLMKGEDEVRRTLDVETGTIYIGASVTSLHEYLFDYLNIFRKKHPQVKIKINTGSNNSTVERLNSGLVDIAFVSTPCNISKNADRAGARILRHSHRRDKVCIPQRQSAGTQRCSRLPVCDIEAQHAAETISG